MMVELLIGDAYFNFMRPTLVFATAGGVITDFADVMIDMIINNLWRIAIALLPLWLLLLSGKNERYQKKRCLTVSAAVTLAGTVLGFAALNVSAQGLGNVIPQYNFNNSMKRNGITVSMFMELTGLADQGNSLEEEAGIADDTVIVLTADHFPYGLGTAWGNDHNCQAELYGVDKYDQIDRDRNSLIIWSGCLEGKGIQVDAPVCSLDVLPTLSNLFGVEYDSRMTVGRDALGTEEAIVPWPDYSWVTELGKFEASTNKFTAFVEESQIPEGYVDRISTIVRNRVNFSRSVQGCQFYLTIQNYLAKK